MADHTEEALFREIDEELKQDRAMQLWQAYGKYAIGLAVCLITAVAGFQGWRAWDISTRTELSDRYFEASKLGAEKPAEAATAFTAIAKDGRAGYVLLARFQAAAKLAESGDQAAAVEALDGIVADSAAEKEYRDLARLLSAIHANEAGSISLAEMATRLAPLAEDGNPWRHSARELTAFAAKSAGDTAKARELYQVLAVDPGTPAGIRERSQAMLATLAD